MEVNKETLPKGWTIAKFEDLLDYIQPTNYIVKSTDYKDTYPTPVLTAGKSFIKGYTNETEGIFTKLPTIIFDDFTTATQFVNFPFKVKSSAMKILQPTCDLVNIKLAFYYMQTIHLKGETHKRFWISEYSQIPVPLAPLNEQKRILAKLEQLLTDLDKGIEYLETTKQQLKVYRQAVLKSAFEGKFTSEWRARNSKLLNAEQLLEKVKLEKETILKANKINSKPIPDISKDELRELPKLPYTMAWLKLGNLLWSVKDGPHYSPKYQSAGIPFISGGNIRPNGIDFINVKYISQELHDELSKRCKPEKGDVLYSKGGTTGIARVNSYDNDFNVWVHVAVLKAIPMVNPFYLQHALNSHHCYKQSQKYTHGVGNQDLGLTRMVLITLPICSNEEQEEIVKEIESRLSVCDKIEETIESSLQQSEALRLSIIKKAFEGKLVPQDSNDEPAEKLLERIRAAKGYGKPEKKKKVKTIKNKVLVNG